MKQLTLFIAFFLCLLITKAQTVKSGNPIVFAEAIFGGSKGKAGGLTGGGELNYQIRRSLISVRLIGSIKLSSRTIMLSPVTPIPIIESKSNSEEFSALYGLRFVNKGRALSLSLGLSHNSFTQWHRDTNNQRFKSESVYLGVPFEFNINWFKPQKKRFRIYGLIPIGQPTALGGSLGFKVFGNISRNSYAGIGVRYGLGYHRKY